MGDADADAESGFKFRVEFGFNKFGFKSGFGALLMALEFAFEAPAASDCCSLLDPCERVEVGFRCVTKRWTI
jgi:hypothetical protein